MINLARAQEIRLESLNDGPGILPFKLGPAKIISHQHTFLQDIDIDVIQRQVDLTSSQLTKIANNLTNNNFSLFKYRLTQLFNKIDQINVQLGTFQMSRTKRGLLNPLGSIIKSITGNLDYNDALRYHHMFQILEKNDIELSKSLSKHITLYKQMTLHQTQILNNLSINQIKLEKAFNFYYNTTKNNYERLTEYAHLSQVFALISDNIHDLLSEVDRIENILAFSRNSIVHHSILSVDNISNMISKLKQIYESDQIINLVDNRYYYNLISLGCYFVDKKIIVVLKFPIATSHSYDFYHLCPVPNRNQDVIIPPSPFLATNTMEFVYMETECPKIDSVYICKQQLNFHTNSLRDCIFTLIHLQEIDESCSPTPVSLIKEALIELDNQHYIISFQQPTKIQMTCGQDRHQTIHGSFLATIPRTCSIRSSEFIITNVNDKLRGHHFEIMKFPQSELQALSTARHLKPLINLTTLDLNKLHDLQNRITVQVPTKPIEISSISTYHTTIPMYTILLLSTLALIIAYYIRHRRSGKARIQEPNIELRQPVPAASCETLSNIQDRKAAIFALNVDK